MSEPEKIDLKEYMGEKFEEVFRRLDGLDTRMESLETDRDERRGRRQLYGALGKVTAGASALIAAVAALLGLTHH